MRLLRDNRGSTKALSSILGIVSCCRGLLDKDSSLNAQNGRRKRRYWCFESLGLGENGRFGRSREYRLRHTKRTHLSYFCVVCR